MKQPQLLFSVLIALVLVMSSCATASPTPDAMMESTAMPDAMMKETATPDTMMHDTPTSEAMMHETPTADAMMQETPADAMMEAPNWFSVSLTDANTGSEFTLNDYEGKVVLVEMMAVWCSTCKQQQDQIKALHEQLGMPADLVTVSLDIDPNEDLDTVKSYLTSAGYDWLYAVAPADVSREIASLYGDQFLNPPSAPVLIVDRHGAVHPLPFGVKSADDLMQAVNMYLKEGM